MPRSIPEYDHEAPQLLGNTPNQGNTAAKLPEYAMSSKCLPKGASRPK